MNYQPPVKETPSTQVEPSATTPPKPVRKAVPKAGLLLVISAGQTHPQIKKQLEMMLKKRQYTGVSVVGLTEHETAIRQLKVDIYGLIGKLGREMSVQTSFRSGNSEAEIATSVAEAVEGHDLGAVLCNLDYLSASGRDITAVGRDELERLWQSSLGFLHSVAKPTLHLLTPERTTKCEPGLTFLVTESLAHSPATLINKAATDALLGQLQAKYAEQGVLVDYADKVLVPEPEPLPEKSNGVMPPPIQTNGFSADAYESPDFTPGESPTRLWNMWALQQEIGD